MTRERKDKKRKGRKKKGGGRRRRREARRIPRCGKRTGRVRKVDDRSVVSGDGRGGDRGGWRKGERKKAFTRNDTRNLRAAARDVYVCRRGKREKFLRKEVVRGKWVADSD